MHSHTATFCTIHSYQQTWRDYNNTKNVTYLCLDSSRRRKSSRLLCLSLLGALTRSSPCPPETCGDGSRGGRRFSVNLPSLLRPLSVKSVRCRSAKSVRCRLSGWYCCERSFWRFAGPCLSPRPSATASVGYDVPITDPDPGPEPSCSALERGRSRPARSSGRHAPSRSRSEPRCSLTARDRAVSRPVDRPRSPAGARLRSPSSTPAFARVASLIEYCRFSSFPCKLPARVTPPGFPSCLIAFCPRFSFSEPSPPSPSARWRCCCDGNRAFFSCGGLVSVLMEDASLPVSTSRPTGRAMPPWYHWPVLTSISCFFLHRLHAQICWRDNK